ncbi:MAG: alpha/beta fold hydrolase [Paracoccaceae bacterium]
MFATFIAEAIARGRCLPHRRVRATADDGTVLFAGLFERGPQGPGGMQVVILFHGAGANMTVGYLDLGRDLHALTGVKVMVPDVRGHGMSQGPRGYAADRGQVWRDVDLWVAQAQQLWPGAAITLAGHSAGAALCLNRITDGATPVSAAVTGFVAIAPYFASTSRLRAQSARDGAEFDLPRFSVRSLRPQRRTDAPEPLVVEFDFPDEAARWCNLVPGYTAEMSAALSPREIDRQLATLRLPTTVLAAERDELFPVAGLRRLVEQAGNPAIRFDTLPQAHLDCLFHAAPRIAAATARVLEAAQ